VPKKKRRFFPQFPSRKPREFALETGFLKDIELYKRRTDDLLKSFWDFYSELAFQRAKVQDQISLALNKNTVENYEFKGWQRAVKYKFSLEPLNPAGSLNDPGGRFNIGEIDPNKFPTFSALYISKDKNTALQEHLGQLEDPKKRLSPLDIALTNPDSTSIVSVKGHLAQIIDLTESRSLSDYVEINRRFRFSKSLIHQMKSLGIPEYKIVQTEDVMLLNLSDPKWRTMPMGFDIPSNSQIFGQLIVSAGIQGILYPSKLTNRLCLAIFPQTFKNTPSFVELAGDLPDPNMPRRIDASNF